MSGSVERFEELGVLLAALCDGEITPEQAARLEQLASRSAESRRFFLDYLQLHGELHWDCAAAAGAGAASRRETPGDAQPPLADATAPVRATVRAGVPVRTQPADRAASRPQPVIGRLPRVGSKARRVAAVLAASLLVALAYWSVNALRLRIGGSRTAPTSVARLTRIVEAVWADSDARMPEGADLAAGEKLDLCQGLVEIAFHCGARVILDGPARLDLESTGRIFLHHGRLIARVPGEAAGFTVRTPSVHVVDLGTEFGVAAQASGLIEIHVFAGSVRAELQDNSTATAPRALRAGQAVRISASGPGTSPRIEEIADGSQSQQFVRALPPPGGASVAELRRLVAQHPRLIHHYTLEGATPQERGRDKRGELDLTEVVMCDGRGGGTLNWSVRGFDVTTNAVATWRGSRSGDTSGVALQSEVDFTPPPQMTVELLLKLAASHAQAKGTICCAVGTRESHRKCGFLVTAADHGQLTHLMDADSPWIEGEDQFAFIPGDWYYVASTFRVESGQTRINSYVANVTRGERELSCVVKEQTAAGVPAVSRLGIGKAFDANLAHAHPWAGELDEVAIYDAALDRATLEQHLHAMLGSGPKDRPGDKGAF